MMVGAFAYRVPPEGWTPPGMARPVAAGPGVSPQRSLTAAEACRTRQFWLLWLVLLLNVSAGIGVIGMASPMLQEIFGGRLIGEPIAFESLDATQVQRVALVSEEGAVPV
jgi:hypothetical protein